VDVSITESSLATFKQWFTNETITLIEAKTSPDGGTYGDNSKPFACPIIIQGVQNRSVLEGGSTYRVVL
jgi:hypothetical protein